MNIMLGSVTTDPEMAEVVRALARDPRQWRDSVPPPGVFILPISEWRKTIEEREPLKDSSQVEGMTSWTEAVPFGDDEIFIAPNDASLVPRLMVFEFTRIARLDMEGRPTTELLLHYLQREVYAGTDRGLILSWLHDLASHRDYWHRVHRQGCPESCEDFPVLSCKEDPDCSGTCVPSYVTDGRRDIPLCVCSS
jgi:hypothetical protein